MISLNLPFPVSVNGMYSNVGKKRIKSPRYKAWRDAAGWALNQQYKGNPIEGPIALQIALTRPDRRKRDLDNCAKGIQDILTGKVINDDSQIKALFMWWAQDEEVGAAITIRKYTGKPLLIQAFNDSLKQPDGGLRNTPPSLTTNA